MAGAEGAAAAVLAGKTDRNAVEEQRAERERFRVMPFVGTACFENFAPPIEHVLFYLRNDFEVFRHTRQAIDNLLQHLGADRRRLAFARIFRLKNRGRFLEARFVGSLFFLDRFHFLQNQLEPHLKLRFEARGFVVAEFSGVDQLLLEKLRDGRALLDFRVEIGLGERRFVAFVVPVAAIAIHVDHRVAAELLAEIERHLRDEIHRERIVAVHVEDRHLDHFRDVRGVHR